MDVLSRKTAESIVVVDGVERSVIFRLTIVAILGDHVELGLELEPGIEAYRSEDLLKPGATQEDGNDCPSDDVLSHDITPDQTTAGEQFEPGDFVRVNKGVLVGLEGTVTQCQARRVTVAVRLVQAGVAVEVDRQMLEIIGGENRPPSAKTA